MHYCFHLVALIEGEYCTLMKKNRQTAWEDGAI